MILVNSFGQRIVNYTTARRRNVRLGQPRLYVWGMGLAFGDEFVELSIYKIDPLDAHHGIYEWSYLLHFPSYAHALDFFDSPWTQSPGWSNQGFPFNDGLNRNWRIQTVAGWTDIEFDFATPVDIEFP